MVTGCLAQTSPEKLRVIDEIDLIVDNANKYLIPKVIKEPDKYNKEIISNIFDIKDFDDNYDDLNEDRSRAFLKFKMVVILGVHFALFHMQEASLGV